MFQKLLPSRTRRVDRGQLKAVTGGNKTVCVFPEHFALRTGIVASTTLKYNIFLLPHKSNEGSFFPWFFKHTIIYSWKKI